VFLLLLRLIRVELGVGVLIVGEVEVGGIMMKVMVMRGMEGMEEMAEFEDMND
jgi:hypothetical protein